MTSRCDFEQQLMQCWNVTEDLDTLCEDVIESETLCADKISNILIGMSHLYQIKFAKLFEMFEKLPR